MRWTVHGERQIGGGSDVRLLLADVEPPGGRRFDHHVVRCATARAGVVVTDPDRGVLLVRRHRFVTGNEGWEIPSRRLEPDESPEHAAEQAVVAATGDRPGPLRPLVTYLPMPGLIEETYVVFVADSDPGDAGPGDGGSDSPGPSTDDAAGGGTVEAAAWLPAARVRAELAGGGVTDGMTLTALSWAINTGTL